MTRAVFVIGRILAALGGLLVIATFVVMVASLQSDCDNTDNGNCDDGRVEAAYKRATVLFPISVVTGAAGVALIYDAHRKLEE